MADSKSPGEPCADYQMSDAFRDWMVNKMRGEVMRQVGRSGLDRMAMLSKKSLEKQEREKGETDP